MKDRLFIFGAVVVVLAVASGVAEWRARSIGPGVESVEGMSPALSSFVSAGVNRDGIPSLDQPTFVSVKEADAYLADDGKGVSIGEGSQARFFPFQILVWHEIVNTNLSDGTPVVVTYDPLSGSALVYRRMDGEKTLTFGVEGKVWNSNLTLYDRETNRLWSQLLGSTLPSQSPETSLGLVPSSLVTWKTWKASHPKGMALARATGFARDYTRSPYLGYEDSRSVLFPVDVRDDRLHPKELVYGYIGADGETKAYPEQYIVKEQRIKDTVNGRRVSVWQERDGNVRMEGEGADGKTMEMIPRPAYWFAWIAAHPKTELYDPVGEAERTKAEATTATPTTSNEDVPTQE